MKQKIHLSHTVRWFAADHDAGQLVSVIAAKAIECDNWYIIAIIRER